MRRKETKALLSQFFINLSLLQNSCSEIWIVLRNCFGASARIEIAFLSI